MIRLQCKIPNDLQNFIAYFTRNLVNEFGDIISGIYIYGSLAMSAYHEGTSDIDFIVLLRKEMTAEELIRLKRVHEKTNDESHYGKQLDGMYLQLTDTNKNSSKLSPYPYCSDGKITTGHYDVNAVTWWTLKHHGITLYGIPSEKLEIEVKWTDIEENMKGNINHYWSDKLKKPYLFLSAEMAEFTILTLCRIICSLETKEIVSKIEAAERLLLKLPEKWHRIMKEGIIIKNQGESLYKNRLHRAIDCHGFLKYVIEYCQLHYFREEK
jgi:hypothetical protein